MLDRQKQQGLISEKEYQRRLSDIKNKQARRNRAAELIGLAFEIPKAILTAFSNTSAGIIGKSIAAAIAGAFAISQFAILAASPLPKFFKGVIDLPLGANKKGKDTIPAMLHQGESVMTAAETKKWKPELMAIREGKMNSLYEKKALQIISHNKQLKQQENPMKKVEMELMWINQRLKDGNQDRRIGNEQIINTFGKRKVRT